MIKYPSLHCSSNEGQQKKRNHGTRVSCSKFITQAMKSYYCTYVFGFENHAIFIKIMECCKVGSYKLKLHNHLLFVSIACIEKYKHFIPFCYRKITIGQCHNTIVKRQCPCPQTKSMKKFYSATCLYCFHFQFSQ